MISLLEKWMPPFVSLLFYRKRKRERHSNTARYLHCGMVIYKYMRYILRWKFIEHKEVPEMLTTSQDRRLLLKTNNTNPDLCAVVSCYVQAVKERSRENITACGAKGLPSSPALPLTERQLGTSQLQTLELTINAFLKTWTHAVATNGSLRQMLADAVSTFVIFTCSSLYVRISLPSERSLVLWTCAGQLLLLPPSGLLQFG